MTNIHDVKENEPKRAILVGVQTPGVSDIENEASIAELSRLVTTLGHGVVGQLSQKRSGTGSALVLGEGKLAELARLTGGTGVVAKYEAPGKKSNNGKGKGASQADGQDDDLDSDDEFDDTPFDANDVESSEEFECADEVGDQSALATEAPQPLARDVAPGRVNGRPNLIVFDCDLSPSQMRNIESACGCPVLDRTGVIIEIFSRHARTRAARLQVEIARLTYLAPRIRETGGGDRQGGGIGGKGAGESSVELDRRKIRDRIKELKSEFESIASEHLTRRARRSDMRTVALVGYTNAGKSSLMRAMTGSEAYVADKLFATLDTLVRPIVPETRPPILVSDTVGFIKKLPHSLVASFKSTLDEALHASLLLYVVDAADATFRSQLAVTRETLAEVGVGDAASRLVLNKCDKLTEDEKRALREEFPDALMISTRLKDDVARLREKLIEFFEGEMVDEDLLIAYTVTGAIGEIRSRVRVLDESYDEKGVRLKVRGTEKDLERIKRKFAL